MPQADPHGPERRAFLGVYFVSCRVYGRLYKNAQGNAYAGHCPRCAAPVRVGIDEAKGIAQRFFKAYCGAGGKR